MCALLGLGVSKGEVDRAGIALRAWWEGPEEAPVPSRPGDLLYIFRAQFENPMKKVTVGVRQFVVRESAPSATVSVGQRLKRAPQIVEKLARHPTMKLSRMQDIGGCRAILADHDEVARVVRRIGRNWQVKHSKHYTLDSPAPSGYRARHVTVERDSRLIEIQLRTQPQHDWAEAIERTDKRLAVSLKSGEGPSVLLEYFRLAADGIAWQEAGLETDPAFMREFERVRELARPYFTRS